MSDHVLAQRAPGVRQSCVGCHEGAAAPFPFSHAFQPIVDIGTGEVFAYEALVRGVAGEGAGTILSQVNEHNAYSFDQASRRSAIELACRLGLLDSGARLSINFMPGAMYEPSACIRTSLAAAGRAGLPASRIIFEVLEQERVDDGGKLREIFRVYRQHGLVNALDDFGAGYAGLVLLADLRPEVLKLDMALTRDIDGSAVKRTIVGGMVGICRELGITLVAEGIETDAELAVMRALGITLVQGYRLAKPAFEALEVPVL